MFKTKPYREAHVATEDNLHRAIVYRTRGRTHGPITRLMSPSDLGEELKPFVFLDLIDAKDLSQLPSQPMGLHPHSGIATLTWLLEGSVDYEDDQGRKGSIEHGWMEWMHAGSGAWHGGGFGKSDRLRGFQLWLALPPSAELGQPYSQYIAPSLAEQRRAGDRAAGPPWAGQGTDRGAVADQLLLGEAARRRDLAVSAAGGA